MRLSADVVNITANASSLQKGETLKDTALNLQALHAVAAAAQRLQHLPRIIARLRASAPNVTTIGKPDLRSLSADGHL